MSYAPPIRTQSSALLTEGLAGQHIDAYRAGVREWVSDCVSPALTDAETNRVFPRHVVAQLGASGIAHERWEDGGDLGKALIIAEELGWAAAGGVGIGISVHLEAVLSILIAHATTDALRARCSAALQGSELGCLAFSEQHSGSDLTQLQTTMHRQADGWRIRGEKAYVSCGAAADFALVLCAPAGDRPSHRTPSLTLVCVPRSGFKVLQRLQTLGAHSLETVRVRIDASIPDDHVVGRHGRGLMIAAYGLTHERFAAAAQLVGALRLAISLAATHLRRGEHRDGALFEHQALRLRLAALHADVSLAGGGLQSLAATSRLDRPSAARAVAGSKVAIAHLAERGMSECLHIFGGAGYVEANTPLARMWRDARLARLGGGGDEILWELVASGLHGDSASYERLVNGA
jgi:alkylation response protein AidB-like acyl-CoA dehydrogenase